MKYQVVRAVNIDQTTAIRHLEQQINDLIAKGWTPIGGIAVSHTYTNNDMLVTRVFQAMIKREA